MKVKAITKKKVFHVIYREHKTTKGFTRFFQVWNNGDFYGTFKTMREAHANASLMKNRLYGVNSNSYIISDNSISVSYVG
jgi:hypothetical protein